MKIRNHRGQQDVAKRLTALLHSQTYPSEIAGTLYNFKYVIFLFHFLKKSLLHLGKKTFFFKRQKKKKEENFKGF